MSVIAYSPRTSSAEMLTGIRRAWRIGCDPAAAMCPCGAVCPLCRAAQHAMLELLGDEGRRLQCSGCEAIFVGADTFVVHSREANADYVVGIYGGTRYCSCPAGRFGRPCWHRDLAARRIERETPKPAPVATRPEPTDAELFAMVGGGL